MVRVVQLNGVGYVAVPDVVSVLCEMAGEAGPDSAIGALLTTLIDHKLEPLNAHAAVLPGEVVTEVDVRGLHRAGVFRRLG